MTREYCQKTGGDPAEDITAFTQNARIGKTCKWRFMERFYRLASGAKARLA
jgi:hypothetical protein